eukprot:TRINITY_DN5498_c0_g1_i1.p1 TRINITY_DN5498_c0_g1~~TRINITY_DN5498_c0_g1_i1.p1  ORF type:complete len:878 (+),score=287.55 TRINITY_DN5498_c0_g1_i1:129-2762(+)
MSSKSENAKSPSMFKLKAIGGGLTTNLSSEKPESQSKMSTSFSDLKSKFLSKSKSNQSLSLSRENSFTRDSIGADLPDFDSANESEEKSENSYKLQNSSSGEKSKVEGSTWNASKTRSDRNLLSQSFKMPSSESLQVGSSANKLYNSSPAVGSKDSTSPSSSPSSSPSGPVSLTEEALKRFQLSNVKSRGKLGESFLSERRESTKQLREFSETLIKKQHREAPSLSDSLQLFAECEARFMKNKEKMMKKTMATSPVRIEAQRLRSATDAKSNLKPIMGFSRSTINEGIKDLYSELMMEKEIRRTKSLSSVWKNTWEISPFYWNEKSWKAERDARTMSVDTLVDEIEGDLEDVTPAVDPFQSVTSSPSLKPSLDSPVLQEDKKDLIVTTKEGKEVVEGGTFESLLLWMIEEETIDQDYVLDFVYTFPSFVRPKTMLDELQRLFKRYGSTRVSSQKGTHEELMQLRILNVIEKWLHFAFPDFEDKELLKQLIEFIEGPVKNQLEESWVNWLQSIIQQKTENLVFNVNSSSSIVLVEATMRRKGTGSIPSRLVKKKNQHYNCMSGQDIVDWIQLSFSLDDRREAVAFATRMYKSHLLLNLSKKSKEFNDDAISFYQFRSKFRSFDPPPKRLMPKKCPDNVRLLEVDPKELARQMTLITEELFRNITARNLIEHVWTDKAGSKAPKAITDFTKRFNDISNWVATEILLSGNVSQRSATVSRFVDAATACFKLKNLSDMVAILCGLNHSTILRLKKTWSMLGAKTKKDLSQLEGYSPAFQGKLRQLHKSGTSPFIPYLGLFVGDLIRLNESPHLISGTSYINFSKRRVQAKLFRQLDTYKENDYVLKRVPEYQNWLKHVILIIDDEKVLMRHSLNCEPLSDE